jgi:GTP-binding protein EngB required for normal cell division
MSTKKKSIFKRKITSLFSSNKNDKKQAENDSSNSTFSTINSQQLVDEKTKEKTILLIGSTGKGKSTLANVLTNTNDFEESSGSTSQTREIQSEKFKEHNTDYCIVDTVGLSDTSLSSDEVLDKIAEAVYLARNGISQVLFIIDGRLDVREMANYDLLRTIIFDQEVVNHTTIIRTRFEHFEDPAECQADIHSLLKESNQLKRIITSVKDRIIHVNNPSLNLLPTDNENEEDEKDREDEIINRKEIRNKSRKSLLNHLNQNCQELAYQPPKLTQLSDEISTDYSEYLTKKKELAQELARLRSAQSSPRSKSSNLIPLIVNNPSPIIEVTNPLKDSFTLPELDIEIGEKIAHLENTKERLQREIAAKEKIIRQKVLKHILNNTDSITEQLGGDILLTNLAEDGHDWTVIHPDFNQELKLKWLKEFDYQATNKWVRALRKKGKDFDPQEDLGFCVWLRDDKHYTASYIPDIQQLISEYAQLLGEEVKCYDKHNQSLATQESVDWTEINSEFSAKPLKYWARAKTYQQLWVSQGLTPDQAQPALSQGFTIKDYMFLVWLRDSKQLKIEQISPVKVESLRAEYQEMWRRLDAKFAQQARDKRTYQQYWEERGLNYTQASAWIKLSGVGSDDCWPWEWTRRGFNQPTTAVWLANGLKENESGLAAYARAKNYPVNSASVQKLKATGILAQEWLDCFYPLEIRNTITYLDISSANLTGDLDLSDLVKLTKLDCRFNKLNSVKLINCYQLKELWGAYNQLTDLVLPTSAAEQLTHLSLSQNNFPAQNLTCFSHLVNCRELFINNNPWTGSLAPLSHLTKLQELRIARTELTELDLASLPSSLTYLDIKNNPNLISPDLTDGTQLVNLEWLRCEGTKLETQLEVYGEPEKDDYDNLNYIHLLKKAQQTYLQNQIEVPLQNN